MARVVNRIEGACGRMTTFHDLCAVIRYAAMGKAGYVSVEAEFENMKREDYKDPREYAYALLSVAEIALPGHGYFQAAQKFRVTCSTDSGVQDHVYRTTGRTPTPDLDLMIMEATKAEEGVKKRELERNRVSGAQVASVSYGYQ